MHVAVLKPDCVVTPLSLSVESLISYLPLNSVVELFAIWSTSELFRVQGEGSWWNQISLSHLSNRTYTIMKLFFVLFIVALFKLKQVEKSKANKRIKNKISLAGYSQEDMRRDRPEDVRLV